MTRLIQMCVGATLILGACTPAERSIVEMSADSVKTREPVDIDPDLHQYLPVEVYLLLHRYTDVRKSTKIEIDAKLQRLYPDQEKISNVRFPCRLKDSERETLIAIALADHGIAPHNYLSIRQTLAELTNPPDILSDTDTNNLKEVEILSIVQSARKRDTFSDSTLLQTPKDEFLKQKALYGFLALSQAFNFEKCRQNNESPIILAGVLHWMETENPSQEEISLVLKDAWSMVQHLHDHPDIQSEFLGIMKRNGFADESAKRQYAYLYDRINSNVGKPQRYGTQVVYTSTGCSPGRLEDKENVETFRAEMGLGTLGEYYASHPGCK